MVKKTFFFISKASGRYGENFVQIGEGFGAER
jgi:hypothetical protein